jgi:hypothetical protein
MSSVRSGLNANMRPVVSQRALDVLPCTAVLTEATRHCNIARGMAGLKGFPQLQAEYKEFLALGHGDIFELEILKAVSVDRFGNAQQPPWMVPGADLSDFFNYDMDMESWRYYCAAIIAYKCASMLATWCVGLQH